MATTYWCVYCTILLFGAISATSICDVANAQGATYFCSLLLINNPSYNISDFNNRTSNITVLAFTDKAKEAIGDPSLYGSQLISLVKYHVVRGVYSFEDLKNETEMGGPVPVRYVMLDTFANDKARVNVTGGQKIQAEVAGQNVSFFAGGASSPEPSIQRSYPFDGGLIHFIDTVLYTPGTAAQTIPTSLIDPNKPGNTYKTILEGLEKTGIMETLASLSDVTILAPADSAFAKIGSVFDGITMDKLKKILGYHVLVGNVSYHDTIPPMSPSWTRLADTLTAGKRVNITHKPIALDAETGLRNLYLDKVLAYNGDLLTSNGNLVGIPEVLDPDHPTGESFPGSASVSSDRPLFTNIIGSSASSSVPSPTSSMPASSPNSPQFDNDNLSAGAKGGIGAGVSIAGLVLLALASRIVLRRQRRSSVNKDVGSGDEASVPAPTELHVEVAPAELVGTSPIDAELRGETIRLEIPAHGSAQELEAGDRKRWIARFLAGPS